MYVTFLFPFSEEGALICARFSGYSVYDYSNGARVGFAPSINNI